MVGDRCEEERKCLRCTRFDYSTTVVGSQVTLAELPVWQLAAFAPRLLRVSVTTEAYLESVDSAENQHKHSSEGHRHDFRHDCAQPLHFLSLVAANDLPTLISDDHDDSHHPLLGPAMAMLQSLCVRVIACMGGMLVPFYRLIHNKTS